MISIIAFIIVIFGCINWLSIGFFQFDLVAGLFGYQGSIFSRIIYIIVGLASIYLTYSVIKHKGRISVKRIVNEEKQMINKVIKKDNNDDNDNNSHKNDEDDENKVMKKEKQIEKTGENSDENATD